ncbi:two component transcriptional regulator, LytTR family [Cyclobacterium lianum]|uniref:Two component transcriptional regulator, LytTR family n=1 Tax=Cyclobacterium lianum TaxID=388280 RepID=A0A1M7M015_9BACT|nr:LytTR family DNA-binding domain-containing protein [Cyclobacterium lianum]SHM83850.1 two component transcriptional regulator, LytTR family [Cyclobacterium lianum]
MKCIIVEDQPPAQRILKKYLEDLGTCTLAGTFSDPIKAMAFLQQENVDLLFLDINLPKISGIELLKSLPFKPKVILTTAHPEYALESYELDVVDYLLKPFSFQRFVKAIGKIPTRQDAPESSPYDSGKECFIKVGYDHVRIAFTDIHFIMSDGDYSEISLAEKKYISSEPLKNWLGILDERIFIRVHKSFIVNVTEISKISGNQIFMLNGKMVPLGRAYKDTFMDRFVR